MSESDVSELFVASIREANGGVWGEHPQFPLEDWVTDVCREETRLGYWEWVCAALIEMEEL